MHPASHRLQLGGDIGEQEAHRGCHHLQEAWVGGILEVSCAGEFKHEALAEAQPEKCSRVYVYCFFFRLACMYTISRARNCRSSSS